MYHITYQHTLIIKNGSELMLKISDFSKLTHVSVRMLRYYDSQGLLSPAKIDTENGYRLYSAEQVPQLQKIVLLRDLNFSVAEIKDLLLHWEDDYLQLQFQNKIDELQALIMTQQKQISDLHSAIGYIHSHQLDQFYNVTVKAIPEYPVISLRRRVDDFFEEGKLWAELCTYVKKNHIDIVHSAKNNIAIYHDTEYMDTGVDIEVCFIVRKLGKCDSPFTYRTISGESHMACMMVYGPYENIAGAYSSFTTWLEQNEQHYKLGESSRQITIISQDNTDNPEEYLTEIQIPLIASHE